MNKNYPNHPFLKTKEEVKAWLDEMNVKNYTIHDDLLVDVSSSVRLYDKKLTHIPVMFNVVGGDFDCSSNALTTLIGAPKIVSETFDCCNNQITDLEGGPSWVGILICSLNKNLKSLKGCAEFVRWDFECCDNPQLTSLEGGPKEVGGTYDCSNNKLNTLKGSPPTINKDFRCSNNNLTSLDFLPTKIAGTLICSQNDIQINQPLACDLESLVHIVANKHQRIELFKGDYDVFQHKHDKEYSFYLQVDKKLWTETMTLLEKQNLEKALIHTPNINDKKLKL